MDLQMEFSYREYKEAVKTTSGTLTDDSIYVFDNSILNYGNLKRTKGEVRSNADTVDLVKIIQCCEFTLRRYP
ncbi:hypothetical protein ACJMK2_035846 [Sinanodonta woodiana]|uniref:Uncharacterized protein n=1 Tax=Sinanodonta woodiana TaxID=1069815 RepID=A0ABD3WFB4_SINWO